MERFVTYTTDLNLECKKCLPANAILCLTAGVLKPVECTNSEDTIPYTFLEVTLDSFCTSSLKCNSAYNYTFKYDDEILVSYDEELGAATEPLMPHHILGAFCKDCMTSWVEQLVGEPAVFALEGGEITYISSAGCRYSFSVEFVLTVEDTSSIDLTLTSDVLSATVKLSPTAGNLLQSLADGLFVAPLLVTDTTSIDLTIGVASQQQTLSGALKVDPAAGNILAVNANGARVADLTVVDTATVDLTYAARALQGAVKISGDSGNIIEARAGGIYAADGNALTEADTATVDLDITAQVLTANVKLSATANNQITADIDGLFVPPPPDPLGSWYPGITMFGTGDDGDRTVTGPAELIDYPVRDYFFDNLTIDAGAVLHPWGYFQNDLSGNPNDRAYARIYVTGTLTIAGAIRANGNDAVTTTPGVINALDGSGGGNSSGGAGGVGESDSGTFTAGSDSGAERDLPNGLLGGGLGGFGGDGGVYSGLGGESLGYEWKVERLMTSLIQAAPGNGALILGGGSGGAGGGGGSRDYTSIGGDGGAGGAGGGVIFIAAKDIILEATGSIEANGGDGGVGQDATDVSGDSADGGGGGGGGGGGLIYLTYENLIDNGGTIVASGGAFGGGGAGVNGGFAGQLGTSGSSGKVFKLKLPVGVFE